jgi:hypothetical protein
MKYRLVIVLLMASVIIAGCASESPKNVAPPVISTVITPSAMPTTPAQERVTITTVITTKKTPAPTAAPTNPIASPISVNGTSGKILRFYTVAPGIVKFTIQYAGNLNKNNDVCSDNDRAVIRLAGASTDTALYNGVATSTYTGTTTYNLISPGNYSLTTRGCYDWQVDIDNA